MKRYGKVIFREGGEKGAKLQRRLIEQLNAQGVIVVTKDMIEKWYMQDKNEIVGCAHSYVLHSKDEVDIFRTVMESDEMKDESVKWKITMRDHDKEFTDWVRATELNNWAEDEYFEQKEKENGERKKV